MTLDEWRAKRNEPAPAPTLPTARQVFVAVAHAMSCKRQLIRDGMSPIEAEARWREARAAARDQRNPWLLSELLSELLDGA